MYPGSTPEFRIYKTLAGESILQVRYINVSQGYTGKWMPVNIVQEELIKQENIE